MSQLLLRAFLFAMRSCEYVKVSGEHWTKLLTLSNICFYVHRHLLPHDDSHLTLVDTVSIMFTFQKCKEQDDIITQHQTNQTFFVQYINGQRL